MSNHHRRSFKRFAVTTLAVPTILGGLLVSPTPVWAQEEPIPVESREPLPVDQLPPLNLPDLPDDDTDTIPETERPLVPQPPPPRPLPKADAVVRNDIAISGVRHFKLFYDGEPIGWSKYRVTGEMKLGETDALILSSEGELRIGFDEVVPTHFISRLMIDRTTLRPSYFKSQQITGDESLEVECVYSDTMIAQTNTTPENRSVHFHNFEGDAPQLVFNNLWGHLDTFPEHYWLMARSAVNGGMVKAYDPILRGEGEVIVYAPRNASYEYLGRTIATKVYDISDLNGTMLATVQVAADTFELLEVEELGSGLKIMKAQPGIEDRLADIPGVDLTDARIVPSNVVFPDAEQLTTLEADVEIDLRGGQLADHRIPGYRQYFTGELTEGVMKGRVFVRSVPREIPFDTLYPLDEKVPEELSHLLKAGPGVEMEYPPLATKAREIAWKSPTTFDAAKRLNSFISALEDGVSLPSARRTLESGVGNAESKALLLVAMSRAIKLPARKISGITFHEGDWVPHHWVEVWLGSKVGWTPFDPTTGEAGRVGAAHIALLDSGDVQNIKVKVTEYAPKTTKTADYIERELQWDLGEKRTYGIYKDGERVGTEVAWVGDIEIVKNGEVFQFEARSEVETDGGLAITHARQLLTPEALPHQIILEHRLGDKVEITTYDFTEDTVVVRPGQPGEEVYEDSPGREYPYARGTYFTDPQLMSHWILMAGQVPFDKDAETDFLLSTFKPGAVVSQEVGLEVGQLEDIVLQPQFSKDKRGTDQEDRAEEDSEAQTEAESDEASAEVESDEPSAEVKSDETSAEIEADDDDKDAGSDKSEKPKDDVLDIDQFIEDGAEARSLITDIGIELWLNDQAQIIKVEVPEQGLELILEKVEQVIE